MNQGRNINGNNPERWKDPVAWDVLTDEQRQIIDCWYKERYDEQKEKEKYQENLSWNSSCFALIPLAVFQGYQMANGEISLMLLIGIVSIWICYAFVFTLARLAYEQINWRKQGILSHLIQILVAMFVTYSVANLIFK